MILHASMTARDDIGGYFGYIIQLCHDCLIEPQKAHEAGLGTRMAVGGTSPQHWQELGRLVET